MKIIGYLRTSTYKQKIDSQRALCNEYAIQHGVNIAVFFRDHGKSGALSLERRSGLLSAIEALEDGDILLIAHRDRLARSAEVMAKIEALIAAKGARIVSAMNIENCLTDIIAKAVEQYSIDMGKRRVTVAPEISNS